MIKTNVKFLLGAIRAERFGIHTGKNVIYWQALRPKRKTPYYLGSLCDGTFLCQKSGRGDSKNR